MGLTGILDLASGRIAHFLTSEDRQHDSKGLYQLSKKLRKGDLLLADRAYFSYEAIAGLHTKGVESVMRLHQMRQKNLIGGRERNSIATLAW